MRLLTSAICTTVAVGLLAGCSGNLGSSSSSLPNAGSAQSSRVHTGAHGELSLVPSWAHPAGMQRLHMGVPVSPDKKSKEVYASEFYGTNVYGWKNPNTSNDAPNCTIANQSYVNGIGSDTKGELIVPTGSPSGINVYKKAGCGALDWSQTDSTGQAADASSITASSKVYVGEIANYTSGVGDVVICTKTGGCGTPVTNSSIANYGAGVTADKAGDCWMSSFNSSGSAILVYWKGCSGSGAVTTGYSASSYGGLFTDKKGQIGAIDLHRHAPRVQGLQPRLHARRHLDAPRRIALRQPRQQGQDPRGRFVPERRRRRLQIQLGQRYGNVLVQHHQRSERFARAGSCCFHAHQQAVSLR